MDNFDELLVERVLELEDTILSRMRNQGYQITSALEAKFRRLIGCNETEIVGAMDAQSVSYLPIAYRIFLSKMGNGAGWVLFRGGDYKCEHLRCLKQQLRGSFGNAQKFPEDAFVFLSFQGTVYYYFLTADKSPDPVVYRYTEETQENTKQSEHFSEYLLEEIEQRMEEDE